jgi:hypothetical protein
MARILVVDDEPLISAMTEDWLSELGHSVVGPAHNLAAALKLAEMDLDAAIVDLALGKDKSYPLADALIGPDGIEPKYRAHSTLGKPFEFATFRRVIDELLASAGTREARGGPP